MNTIQEVKTHYVIENQDAALWVYFYLSKRCVVYDEYLGVSRFPEFGFTPSFARNWREDYIEPCSWRNHLITDLSEEDKCIEFQYSFYFYPDEDNQECIEQLNDNGFWIDIFKEFYKCNLILPKYMRYQILEQWQCFKDDCLNKDIEIKSIIA